MIIRFRYRGSLIKNASQKVTVPAEEKKTSLHQSTRENTKAREWPYTVLWNGEEETARLIVPDYYRKLYAVKQLMRDVILFATGLLSYLPEGSYLTCHRICPTCKRASVLRARGILSDMHHLTCMPEGSCLTCKWASVLHLSYLHVRELLSYLRRGFLS